MKHVTTPRKRVSVIACSLLLVSCGLNPQNADMDMNESLPETKITIYQKGVDRLGMMTQIYSNAPLKIMAKDILDNTGTSVATSAEVPRDMTEMVKSTLNAIGGNVLYIPYEPEFMTQTAGTGYSDYGDKLLPQVILSGGITEFDRALVTKGDSLEADITVKEEYGINFSDEEKSSLANLTLDFNLIDFKTFTGIPRIQAVNGIKLSKVAKQDSLGLTVKSATFGAKGEIKKVQGRHAAVRLLVQLSMIQIIGRYQKLPYWKLIPGALRDEVVTDQVLADFYSYSPEQQLAKFQELLYLHGFNVKPTGQMDSETQAGLQKVAQDQKLASSALDQNLYLALYENVPISAATRQRRKNLNVMTEGTDIAAVPSMTPATTAPKMVAPDPKPAPVATSNGRVMVGTDKSDYKVGDKLKINFSVTEPMYVRMVVINSKGDIDTLFPNAYQSDNFCKPGVKYSIPSARSEFTLDIGGPVGTDKIRAVASNKPIPADALFFTKEGQFDDSKMSAYKVRAATDYTIH